MEPTKPTPEVQSDNEKRAAGLERLPVASSAPVPASPPSTSHNVSASTATPIDPVTLPVSPAPSTPPPPPAADADVIEKVWVDKAETVIERDKNNPHQEEEAAEALSHDYLQQRFGIDTDKT